MLLPFLILAAAPDWIPARWPSNDPKSLEIVRQTPINCLLLERAQWSAAFSEEAAKLGIATLELVRSPNGLSALAPANLNIPVISLGPRTRINFDSNDPVLGTNQGVWPGINAAADGAAKAAPSGGPWLDTNTGFLRFARSLTKAGLWIAYSPPKGQVIPLTRYLQAIGDAAIVGARWVVSLDDDFQKRLLAREASALKDWRKMGELLAYFEAHKDWRSLDPYAQLAIVQDADSGGLISGGILDMVTVKHTPVRPVPARKLSDDRMKGVQLAVNVNPGGLTEEQKETLRRFTRAGNTLLNAPPGWKFPPQREDQITLDKDDVEKLDTIWKEVNSMTGRRNLGARLFNVSSMLSNLVAPPGGRPLILHLLNYSDYTVENVTVHVLGKYTKAHLYEPGAPQPRKLNPYENEEGSGVDIDKVSTVATIVLE
jgi:hypothetical protein